MDTPDWKLNNSNNAALASRVQAKIQLYPDRAALRHYCSDGVCRAGSRVACC